MSTDPTSAITEYLQKHGLDVIAIADAAEIEHLGLSRRERRDNLVRWENQQDDTAAPPGVAGIVAHNIEQWAENLWPGQGNRQRSVMLTNSEIESLFEMAGDTQSCPSHGEAYLTLQEYLPKVRT